MTCSAQEKTNIDQVWNTIEDYCKHASENNYFEQRRHEQNKFWLLATINQQLKDAFYSRPAIKKAFEKQLSKVNRLKITPFDAAEHLLHMYYKKSES